jgi:glycosyltransferase involved in cell wall biosynthesis
VKRRIALLSAYPSDLTSFFGGVETATAALLEGLREIRHEFEFHLISAPRGLKEDEQIQHLECNFHFLTIPAWARPRSPYRVARIIRELRRISPDLVHCMGSMDMALAAIWSSYPRLFTIHGIRRGEVNKRVGWENWSAWADAALELYVYRHFRDVVCISSYAQHVVGQGKRVFRIPNAVRPTFFRAQRDDNPRLPRLLFVGILSPLKRPGDLLQAHRRLRDQFPALQTVLCGEPESRRFLDTLLSQADEGVRFIGRMDQEGLIHELSKATVLVLPSSQENAPIAIAEAMAAGVPVVATRVGGVPEMLREGQTGMLYHAGDVDALIAILRDLLMDPKCRQSRARAAQEDARVRFAPNQVARQTVNAYKEIMNTSIALREGHS